ncbi:1539_t:CDS:2 [Funneliformis mosseae]|uniref:Reticulon-like protein n=1 Tax=Funneliformis mosseae TaxID=27381 RepID=A0A9N8UZP5_FUNMO|nr:1539_t:CDS:2 [Funneliformis mosseae]
MDAINDMLPETLKEAANMSSTKETSNEPEERRPFVVNNERKTEASSKRITKNPFKTFTYKVEKLVYWENSTNSAAVLLAGLSFLIFTSYYSLFNTFCALAVTLIGSNWIYVNGRKQLHSLLNQKPVNPYETILAEKPWHIERENVEKYLDFTIEAINFSLLEIQRIVLVEDPLRTIKVPVVLGFTAPIGYQKNQKLVDEKLNHINKILHTQMDRGFKVAKQHTGGIYEKARTYAGNLKKEE